MTLYTYYEFAHEAPIVRHRLQTPSTRLTIFLLYSLLDLAINTSAGAAAAAAGAHANGVFSARAVQLGALAGCLKSAWHTTTCLIGWSAVHWFWNLALVAVTNDFVFAELLVVAMSAITLGEIPKSLCIAALAGAVPLHFQLVRHVAYPVSGLLGRIFLFIPCCCAYILKPHYWPLLLVAFDALGGVAFAGAARAQGYTICPLSTAAAAGAVYGLIVAIPSVIISRPALKGAIETGDAFHQDDLKIRTHLLTTGEL